VNPLRSAPLALALAALAGAGCSRGPAPVHVLSLRLADGALAEPLREAGLDREGLESSARDALAAAGFREGEGKRAVRARVDVLSVRTAPPLRAGAGALRVEVTVQLELEPASEDGPPAAREAATSAAPLGGAGPGPAAREAFAAAARRAAEALAIGYAADAKPIEALLAELDAEDARVRDHAVRVLAERRSAAAVPALVERLRDEDADVVLRAIGALGEIGDLRAVDPLIEVSWNSNAAFTARVARVIGDIGGPDAEGYLLTLSSGHPDPGVRRAADEALAELRSRAAQPAVAHGAPARR
jgi:HEAT repeat protein